VQPVLAQSCYTCHNSKLKTADLDLESLRANPAVADNTELWQRVAERIGNGTMPPEGMPRPEQASIDRVSSWIREELGRAERNARPDPGRVTARRLNRAEYNNTIRDLLGVDFHPADDFPQDDSGYGFDNIGDVLSLSPALLERYLKAAETAVHLALNGPDKMKPIALRHQPPDRVFTLSPKPETVYDESGLSMPMALHTTMRFPAEGDYDVRVALEGRRPNGAEPVKVGFWVDGKLMHTLELPGNFDGGSLDLFGAQGEFRTHITGGDHWIAASLIKLFEGLPESYAGPNPSKLTPFPSGRNAVPVDANGDPLPAGAAPPNAGAGGRVRIPMPDAPPPAANGTTPPASAGAAPPNARGGAPGQPGGAPGRGGAAGGRGGGRGPGIPANRVWVHFVEAQGPYDQKLGPDPASLRKVLACGHFDGKHTPACDRKIVSAFARRAFRRTVTDAELAPYLKLAADARKTGASFNDAIAAPLEAILVSADFLFRMESDNAAAKAPAAPVRPIGQFALASRLSSFLWSSTPDDELLKVAEDGALRKPEVLSAQVQRMLKDPKARALVENFAGQWLELRRLESVVPNREKFPEFDEYLRMSMRKETELFFESVVRDNRSVLDLLDAKDTYLNEKLAAFYGIPGVKGQEFRRVELTDPTRGGVLTQASVLTVTSYATRTSPVLRGKWILENMLNAPVPPPPPDVPALDEAKVGAAGSMRTQMEEHRNNPVCASCHSKMDPLGFAFENFNAIGRWRTEDGKFPVDPSGALPDGRAFQGPGELKALLHNNPQAFTECIAEKLLTYALGRGLEGYDRPVVKQIAEQTAKQNYRFTALVMEIVNSLPFQNRRGDPTQ